MPDEPAGTDRKVAAIAVIIVILAVCLLIVVLSPVLTGNSGKSPQPGGQGQVIPVSGSPSLTGQVTGIETPAVMPAKTGLSPSDNQSGNGPDYTGSPTPTVTAAAPLPYTLSISPVSASAKPGETLTYIMSINGGEGMTGPVHISLTAGALFVSGTYDLGDIQPPFPKSISYPFTVPGNVPSGVTIRGKVTATGGGQEQSQDISLTVT